MRKIWFQALLASGGLCVAVWGQGRGLQGCGIVAGEGTFELTKELSHQILKSADLIELVHSISLTNPDVSVEGSGFVTLESFCDINDVAIVAREGTTCYAGFRGTNFANIFDYPQLFYPAREYYEGCKVRSGVLSAYFSAYYDNFRAAVTTCMESASELVLTGHSQGGAIGVVGSIDLREYNPKVISIGPVRALAEPCGLIDTSRHYRFVNTGNQEYDFWPMEFGSNSLIHVGHTFLLDATASNPAAYLGLDNDVVRSPTCLAVHDRGPYREGLDHMIPDDTSCFPAAIGGWETTHWCTMDDECQSGTCFSQQCSEDSSKLEMGEECSDDTECKSGMCRRTWWLLEKKCD